MASENEAPSRRPFCSACSKPSRLCICSRIKPSSIPNSISVTILQHNLERNHPLNSTRIASLALQNLVVALVSDVHFEATFLIRFMNRASINSCSGSQIGVESSDLGGEKCEIAVRNGEGEAEKAEGIDGDSGEFGILQCSVRNAVENGCSKDLPSVDFDRVVLGLGLKSSNGFSDPQAGAGVRFSIACDWEQCLEAVEDFDSASVEEGGVVNSPKDWRKCSGRVDSGREQGFQTSDDMLLVSTTTDKERNLNAENTRGFQKCMKRGDFDKTDGCAAEMFKPNSQNDFLVAGMENGLRSPRADNGEGNFGSFAEPPAVKKNSDPGSGQKQLEKPVSEPISDSTAVETDSQTGTVSCVEDGSPMNSPKGCIEHCEKLDFELEQNLIQTRDEATILNAANPVNTCSAPAQSSIRNVAFDPTEDCQKQTVVRATISKYTCTCSISNLYTRRDIPANPHFDQLSNSSLGKELISSGFVVRKLKRKLLGEIMEFEEFNIAIPPGSVLLFPSKKAIDLEAIDFEINHLIVLDGTWAKARRMYYENPWLQLLPHLKLNPRELSLYNEVRHQPKAGCLSTIESIVYALKALGDTSTDLDSLLDVFESMIGDQRQCKIERLSKLSSA